MSYLIRMFAVTAISAVLIASPSLHAGGKRKDVRLPVPTNALVSLKAYLNGASALPGNSEAASGDVIGTFDPKTHVLRFYARFVNLSGPATNAKFHGPAAFDRGGWATVAAPRPESRLVSGTAWLDAEEENDLLAGRWYSNVTTAKHPQGEIRGMVNITTNSPQL